MQLPVACLTKSVPSLRAEWVWLKIKQEGQTAGFGPCFHLPGQPILEFRLFEPQPNPLTSSAAPPSASGVASPGRRRRLSGMEGLGMDEANYSFCFFGAGGLG